MGIKPIRRTQHVLAHVLEDILVGKGLQINLVEIVYTVLQILIHEVYALLDIIVQAARVMPLHPLALFQAYMRAHCPFYALLDIIALPAQIHLLRVLYTVPHRYIL